MDDARVRRAAFDWLTVQVDLHGDVLPRDLLSQGFHLDGMRVPLLGPPGIFKPRVLIDTPLSITTAPGGPYDDHFDSKGFLRYRYRGIDPNHSDNRGLRRAMEKRVPLIYFHGIVPGKYLATWPVYVIADNPSGLYITVVVDDVHHISMGPIDAPANTSTLLDEQEKIRRSYATFSVRKRLHQRAFRERVLTAYQRQCAFCYLRHEELLDAAHIIPDSDPQGEPQVQNGLALCSLHHNAFDRHFIGVRPDYIIEIRRDILEEVDGPTLAHAIQALHGCRIILPRSPSQRPNPEYLLHRYERFLETG